LRFAGAHQACQAGEQITALRVSEPAVEKNERNFSLCMAGCGVDGPLTAPAEQSVDLPTVSGACPGHAMKRL